MFSLFFVCLFQVRRISEDPPCKCPVKFCIEKQPKGHYRVGDKVLYVRVCNALSTTDCLLYTGLAEGKCIQMHYYCYCTHLKDTKRYVKSGFIVFYKYQRVNKLCRVFGVSLEEQILVLNLSEHSTQSRQSLMGAGVAWQHEEKVHTFE